MNAKLLVNSPDGRQEVVEVIGAGGYFDTSRVLWDERKDGPLPDIALGGMVRDGAALRFDPDLYAQYQMVWKKKELAATRAALEAAVQARLNAWAAERGYGTEKTEPIVSLCTYATDPSPRLALEGQRGVDMRSATWEACYQILNDVAGGKRPVPTVEDVFDELPALTWPS